MRRPLGTGTLFAITLTTNVVQFCVPGTLSRFERAPSAAWWRLGTALFVQDGGVVGTISNLAFLLVVGVCAEQVVSRWWLVGSYFGVGLATEAVALSWQPHGGGNSIAICGLTGLVAVALWRGDPRLPRWAPIGVMLWCGALLATWSVYLIAVCAAAPGTARLLGGRAPRVAAGLVVGTGVVLGAVRNIHGAALLFSLVIAVVAQTVGGVAYRGDESDRR